MIESAMVAEDLHVKGQPRKQELGTFRAKRKAVHEASKAENAEKNSKQPTNSNASNKKRKKNGKKSSTYLGPEKLKEYKEQGRCFQCGSKEHMKRDCPHATKKDESLKLPLPPMQFPMFKETRQGSHAYGNSSSLGEDLKIKMLFFFLIRDQQIISFLWKWLKL